MTSLLEGARRLITRGSDLGGRIEALQSAAEAARGRLDDDVVDQARGGRGARREPAPALGRPHRGRDRRARPAPGKSSTFNQLTGLELSAVGVRRPTTSWATACVWGSEGAQELLEWLGIPPRHQTTRDSMLDTSGLLTGRREDGEMEGVVLLDLPDHDSTEVTHHLEVDRIVKLADLLVWVLDPQKYADAAIHDRYLAPQASHAGVMVVVLNHIDTVPAERRTSMLEDVRRLLDQDGLQRGPGDRHQRPPGRGHRRAPRRDRPPGGGQEVDPAAHRGRPARRGRPPQRGVRHRQAALAGGRPGAGDGGGARRVRRRADRGLRHRAVHPDARRAGHRLAGRLVAVAAQAGPAAPAAPRPRPPAQAAHRPGAHVDPRGDARAARQGRHRGPRPRRRRVGRDDPAVGGRRAAGLDLAGRRDGRPARRRDRRHRPGRGEDPGLGGRRAGAAVAADPGRAASAVAGPSRSPPRARWATTRCRPTAASTSRS